MQKGHNTDIEFSGLKYHVQTEDWGTDRELFVTRIFYAGAVIQTIKVPYTKVLPNGPRDPQIIKIAIDTQHQSVVDMLLSGQLIPR